MSGGEVAGVIVAVFWAILVSFLAVALFRLAQALRAAGELVTRVTDEAVPLLADASATVRSAHSQLARVDAIASDVQEVTANASALSSTVSTAFGGPLVKVAAFGYGVRRALDRGRAVRGADDGGAAGVSGTGGKDRVQDRVIAGRLAGRWVPGARRNPGAGRGRG